MKLKTSSLNFDLLVYFLNNPNEIINREKLKQHVWNGRVVSDATVYKQIKRLKQELLTNISTEELIQTVHGKGVVFVAEVKLKTPDETHITLNPEDTIQSKPTKSSPMLWMLFIVLMVFVIIGVYQVKSIKKDNFQLTKKIERLAILYQNEENSEKSIDTHVMAEALRAQMLISDNLKINLEETQLNNSEFNQISTKLIQKFAYNHVLNMEISTHEFGVKAHVSLRKGQKIFPNEKFEAKSRYLLLKNITTWALSKILTTKPDEMMFTDSSVSEEAFDDYLAAMRAKFNNDPDLAIVLLQQAIAKDPGFVLAINSLGVSYFNRGKLYKAIEIFKSINLSDASYNLKLGVEINLAGSYFRLGQVNLATKILERLLLPAIEQGDAETIAIILLNQSLMYISLGELDTARKKLEKAIFFIDDGYQKTLMASAYLNLTSVHFLNFEIEKALYYSKLSYDTYVLAGNKLGMTTALSDWSSLLMKNAEFEQAYKMSAKVIENISNQDEILPELYALETMITIEMQVQVGKLKKARIHLDIYEEKLQAIENSEYTSTYLKLEYLYATLNNDLLTAASFIERLFQLANTAEDKAVKLNYSLLNIDFLLKTEKVPISQKHILNLTKYINDEALLWLAKAEIHAHNKDIDNALTFFEKALIQFEKQNQKFELIKSIKKYLQFIQGNNVTSNNIEYWRSVLVGILNTSKP